MERKKYSSEFKEQAVRRVVETCRPIVDVSREIGINEGTLSNWVWLYCDRYPVEESPLTVSERAQLKELQAEVRELRMKTEFFGPVDLLGRDFTAVSPGVCFVGDITYISTWQGWVYLATVIDLCTKEVVGWAIEDHLRTSLVCDALSMAGRHRPILSGAVFHSDRGCQYTSSELAAHLKSLDMIGSMGRTGVWWDNALAESFFASLKKELVHRTVFSTRKKARDAVAEYIEVFYNRQRLHSGIGYQTPIEVYEAHQQSEAASSAVRKTQGVPSRPGVVVQDAIAACGRRAIPGAQAVRRRHDVSSSSCHDPAHGRQRRIGHLPARLATHVRRRGFCSGWIQVRRV